MEGMGLAAFMVSACLCATLLEHPASPARQAISAPLVRRLVMGLAMGLTAVGIIYSPWGTRSGAHINPAVTLTFLRLGKVQPWDAFFYVVVSSRGARAASRWLPPSSGLGLRIPTSTTSLPCPARGKRSSPSPLNC
jgi:aquaporin Z